jgi:hypothetical protein
MLALGNPKVRKVRRARGIRAQKGAKEKDPRAARVSLGATRKVAEDTHPPKEPKFALFNTVVSMPTHLIVIAIPVSRKD